MDETDISDHQASGEAMQLAEEAVSATEKSPDVVSASSSVEPASENLSSETVYEPATQRFESKIEEAERNVAATDTTTHQLVLGSGRENPLQ